MAHEKRGLRVQAPLKWLLDLGSNQGPTD